MAEPPLKTVELPVVRVRPLALVPVKLPSVALAVTPLSPVLLMAVVLLVVGPLVRKRPRAMVGVPTVKERWATTSIVPAVVLTLVALKALGSLLASVKLRRPSVVLLAAVRVPVIDADELAATVEPVEAANALKVAVGAEAESEADKFTFNAAPPDELVLLSEPRVTPLRLPPAKMRIAAELLIDWLANCCRSNWALATAL